MMEGLLTHVAKADCFLTLPHPALECGIITAWWRGVEAEPGCPTTPESDRGLDGR